MEDPETASDGKSSNSILNYFTKPLGTSNVKKTSPEVPAKETLSSSPNLEPTSMADKENIQRNKSKR